MVDAGGIANSQQAPSAPLTPVYTGLGWAKLPLLQEKNETTKGPTTGNMAPGRRCSIASSSWWKSAPNSRPPRQRRDVRDIQAPRLPMVASRRRYTPGRTMPMELVNCRTVHLRVAAPVDGTVQGLKIQTPGAVVTTADTLMTLVPDGTGIEVDCLAQNKDIGFVGEGQDKLEAFPFTRYGLVPGPGPKTRPRRRQQAARGAGGGAAIGTGRRAAGRTGSAMMLHQHSGRASNDRKVSFLTMKSLFSADRGVGRYRSSCYWANAAWMILFVLTAAAPSALAAEDTVRPMTRQWSVPRFSMRDMVRSSDGPVTVLTADDAEHKLSLLIGLSESGFGRTIPLSIDAAPLGRELRLAGGPGDTLWIGGSTNFRRTMSSSGLSDGYLAKLDRQGHVAWERQFGRDRRREIQDLASLDAGDVVVVGRDDDRTWLARVSADGQVVWEKTFGLGKIASVSAVGDEVWVAAFDRDSADATRTDQGRVTVWRFDGKGEMLGQSIVRDELATRPQTFWLMRILKGPRDAVYVFSAWMERPAPKPLVVTKMDTQGRILWQKDVPGTIWQGPHHPDVLCELSFVVLENSDAVVACPNKGLTAVTQIAAGTSELSRVSVPMPEMPNCDDAYGVAQFLLERPGQKLWLLGGGSGCSWLGQVSIESNDKIQ